MLFKQVYWIRLIADCSKRLIRSSQRSKMSTSVVTMDADTKVEDTKVEDTQVEDTKVEDKVEDTKVEDKVEETLKQSEVKDEDTPELRGEKRKLEEEEVTTSGKKEKTDVVPKTETETASLRRRKVALLLSYSGKGFYGLQRQKDFPTIEGALAEALLSVGVISKDDVEMPQKMSFQRAARTDKGVSAAGNLVSLKMSLHVENFLEEISKVLPHQIKVQACIRMTKSFDSKNYCDGRTYSYMTPSYAFAPHKLAVTEKYRVPEDTIDRVRGIIKKFEGTHNFHNFTSGLKPTEAKAKRYIISFKCDKPFVRDDMEFVQLTVRGQSFMLHHIRKMIGLTLAIVRGCCGEEVIEKSWSLVKVDIPKAPGNGLMLEELHYHHYNKRYGNDGIHQSLDWTQYREKIDQFKEEQIYPEMIRSEKEEHSMMKWLATLDNHDYDEIPPEKLLNWKFKASEENNKKEKATVSITKMADSLGRAISDEKDAKSSSTENGKDDASDQDQTKNTADNSGDKVPTDKDVMARSGDEVPTDTDKSDDKVVKDKDTDNKMDVS